jgi:hypothetical protein
MAMRLSSFTSEEHHMFIPISLTIGNEVAALALLFRNRKPHHTFWLPHGMACRLQSPLDCSATSSSMNGTLKPPVTTTPPGHFEEVYTACQRLVISDLTWRKLLRICPFRKLRGAGSEAMSTWLDPFTMATKEGFIPAISHDFFDTANRNVPAIRELHWLLII